MRACAALRVECFYSYTDDNAPAILFGPHAESAEMAWAEARLRVEAARAARMQSLGMQVTCLAAVCCSTQADAVHGGSLEGGDPVRGGLRAIRRVQLDCLDIEVVGTLDIHVGDRLPGEPLEGTLPGKEPPKQAAAASNLQHPWWLPYATAMTGAGATASLSARSAYGAAPWAAVPGRDRADTAIALPPFIMPPADAPEPFDAPAVAAAAASAAVRPSGATRSRAYIFNVCVSPSARRRGVAAALLSSAHDMAAAAGVEVLYVHVEEENSSARRLYSQAGYAQESMEPEWLALRMGRPRRLLLRKWLTPVADLKTHSGDN